MANPDSEQTKCGIDPVSTPSAQIIALKLKCAVPEPVLSGLQHQLLLHCKTNIVAEN